MLFQQAVHEVKIVKIHMKTSEPKSLFHKVAGPQTAVLLKNILRLRCFPVNFHKFLKDVLHRTLLGDYAFSSFTFGLLRLVSEELLDNEG